MSRKLKLITALFTVFCLMFATASPAFAQNAADLDEETVLRFNDDGKFTIIQFADCQDDVFAAQIMIDLMKKACETIKPDLVVFSGDNVSQAVRVLNEAAIKQLVAPLAELDIPFAVTFGNHDAENDVPKNIQVGAYKEYGNCLTYNADSSIHGYGNCYLPILGSDGSDDIGFNLWLIDSNMYHDQGGYDIVYPDQVAWYKATSEALEAQAGHKINSLMFQHIIMPEVFDYMVEATGADNNTKHHIGRDKSYILEFKETAMVSGAGALNEFPCPPNYNTNQYETLAERGDVLAVMSGHDHVNSFILTTESGIDIVQTPGMSYQSYGSDEVRGFRVFTIDESDTSKYETETYTYYDFFTESEIKNKTGNLSGILPGLLAIVQVAFKTAMMYLGFADNIAGSF